MRPTGQNSGTSEYRSRGRGESHIPCNSNIRATSTATTVNTLSEIPPIQQLPRTSTRYPPSAPYSSSIYVNYHPQFQPIYNRPNRTPNMSPPATFPSPYSVAASMSYSATTASIPARVPYPVHQSHQGILMIAPTSAPVAMHPYNAYGYADSMNQMGQHMGSVPQAFPRPATATGQSNCTSGATGHPAYECSDISDEEDAPQDLRVKKKQQKPTGNGRNETAKQTVPAAASSIASTSAAAAEARELQPGQTRAHKKFQYKQVHGLRASGCQQAEPSPSSSSSISHTEPMHTTAASTSSGQVEIESLVDELTLSPYITREQAISRLYAWRGNKEAVQREINSFGAIITCGRMGVMVSNRAGSAPGTTGSVESSGGATGSVGDVVGSSAVGSVGGVVGSGAVGSVGGVVGSGAVGVVGSGAVGVVGSGAVGVVGSGAVGVVGSGAVGVVGSGAVGVVGSGAVGSGGSAAAGRVDNDIQHGGPRESVIKGTPKPNEGRGN